MKIEEFFSNFNDKPLTDIEFKELMKFNDEEIDIANIEFKISTAEEIAKDFDISNFFKE